MHNPEDIEKSIGDSIELGRATTPRSLYQTASGIYLLRTLLENLNPDDEVRLLASEIRTRFPDIQLTRELKTVNHNYNSIVILDEHGDLQSWEAREYISPKGRRRFQIWWGPRDDYSSMADGHVLPYPHLIRVDQYLQPEQILSLNRNLLEAHRRTPVEVAAA